MIVLDGIRPKSIEGSHGESILDLSKVKIGDLDKMGIGYVVPVKQGSIVKTIVYFFPFSKYGEDVNHMTIWLDKLSDIVLGKNGVYPDEFEKEDFQEAYTGLPRFRIEKVEDKFRIFYGENICNAVKNKILKTVGLKPNEVEWYYDSHEEMDRLDRSVVSDVIGLEIPNKYCI